MNARTSHFALMLLAVVAAVILSSHGDSRASGPETQGAPVLIGMTGEFGLKNSFSAQAIELGIRVAMAEINARGGVLNGRTLMLKTRDDRSVPARAIDNMHEFLTEKDLVALFGARFSPVMLDLLPHAQESELILLDPWASADGITNHALTPNFAFRLSLKDSLAMPTMLEFANRKGWKNVALVLPNTSWGRSNEKAALSHLDGHPEVRNVCTRWYNWGDVEFSTIIDEILDKGADAMVLVANDIEGSAILKQMATKTRANRIPIVCHWGITGGDFFASTMKALQQTEL
jgi:branched-chain amino acid transport system substrate-binding protein